MLRRKLATRSWKHGRQGTFFLMYSWLLILMVASSGLTSAFLSSSHENQVNQVTYDLYLEAENTNITRGEDLYVSLGLVNASNTQMIFISDVEVRLELFNESNQLVFSEGYNTTNSLLNVSISFKYLLSPGNYTLRGETIDFTPQLSKNITITVYIASDPKLAFLLPTDPVQVTLNEEYSLYGEILNTGGSSAFNISVSIGLVDNFPLSEISSSLPQVIERLNSNSRYAFTVNVTLTDFGEIELSLALSYIDENDEQFITSFPLSFYTLPRVIFHTVQIPSASYIGDVSSFDLFIQNQENVNFQINVRVISEDVDIIIQAFLINLDARANTTISIKFIGFDVGLAKVKIFIDFIERNGDVIPNAYELAPIYITIAYPSSFLNQKPTNSTLYSSIRPWLLTLLLSFIGLLSSAVILYIFRFSIYEFFHNIFNQFKYKTSYSIGDRSFEYESDVVVVDGSNVAWDETEHGKARLQNILTAINVLKAKGFKEIIIVIDAALRYQIDDRKGLDNLIRQGIIKPLPARVKADQFIIRLAEEKKAMILSNDLYREYRDDVPWIDERRIPFTILNKELYLHPTLKRSLKLQQEELLKFKDPSHPVKPREETGSEEITKDTNLSK